MDYYIENIAGNYHKASQSPTSDKFKKIHSRIQHLSAYIYPKVSPYSLKDIENRSKGEFNSKGISRTPRIKDNVIENLHKNHIKSQQTCKIVVLPKSPFGKHEAYNEESNFSKNHFLLGQDINSEKQDIIKKKVGLLNKRIKKIRYSSPTTARKAKNELYDEFKTNGGKLICQRPISLIQIYQNECEQYKAHNLGKNFETLSKERKTIDDSNKFFKKNVFNRLYSPTKKAEDSNFKKYEKLFESKVLKLN